jgi:hypothetical protein
MTKHKPLAKIYVNNATNKIGLVDNTSSEDASPGDGYNNKTN